jgi:uncharacterized RDD family membrane protein YckC
MSEQKYAGFWIRFLAFLIDSLLVCMIIIPLLLSFYGRQYFAWIGPYIEGLTTLSIDLLLQAQTMAAQRQDDGDFIFNLILPAIAVITFWKYKSATPGKIILGMKIVDAKNGGQPSMSQCAVRYLGYFVSSIPLFLGMIWVGLDARKQGWHDKLAGTVVIKT